MPFPCPSLPAALKSARPAASPREPSAAQNVTVIKTCTQCGAINGAEASVCCCCDARLSRKTPEYIFARASFPAPGAAAATHTEAAINSAANRNPPDAFSEQPAAATPPAMASQSQPVTPPPLPSEDADDLESNSTDDRDPRPPWRREVAYRLNIYKARRQHLCADNNRPPAFPAETSAGRRSDASSTRAAANARADANGRPAAGKMVSRSTHHDTAARKNSAANGATKQTTRPTANKTADPVAKDRVVKDAAPKNPPSYPPSNPPLKKAGDLSPNLAERRRNHSSPATAAHAPAQAAAQASTGQPPASFTMDVKKGGVEDGIKDSAKVVSPAAKPASPPPRTRLPWQDHLEIDVAQPSLNFTSAHYYPSDFPISTTGPLSWSDSPHSPAAPLTDRALAGMIDAALLAFFYGGFLALFWALGGRFSLSKLGAAITAATFGLLYAQYFLLFTVFGGATPGMMARGLRAASFDGADPASTQLLWRGFGYIVSAAIALLGFAWSIWDQDHLTWHDRISQTYLVHR